MSSVDSFYAGFWFGVFVAGAVALRVKEGKDDWWRNELARRGHAHYYLDETPWGQAIELTKGGWGC